MTWCQTLRLPYSVKKREELHLLKNNSLINLSNMFSYVIPLLHIITEQILHDANMILFLRIWLLKLLHVGVTQAVITSIHFTLKFSLSSEKLALHLDLDIVCFVK